jgi:hypothetical protein
MQTRLSYILTMALLIVVAMIGATITKDQAHMAFYPLRAAAVLSCVGLLLMTVVVVQRWQNPPPLQHPKLSIALQCMGLAAGISSIFSFSSTQ